MNRFFSGLKFVNVLFYLSILFALFVIISVFIFPPIGWEDYSITYNGARLIHEGYKPYTDFGIATGVGNFILPYLAFKLLGIGYNSLYILQSFEHVLCLILSFKILEIMIQDKQKTKIVFIIFSFFFTLSVINKVKIPFYNSEFLIYQLSAYYFILLSQISKGWKANIYSILTALFVFLTLQVKQDFGGLLILIVFVYYSYHYILEKNWKKPLVFLISFVVFILFFLMIVDIGDFLYWFNYGQAHHPIREILNKLKYNLLNSTTVIYILFMIIFYMSMLIIQKGKNVMHEGIGKFTFPILLVGLGVENIITLTSSNFPSLVYSAPFLLSAIVVIAIQNKSIFIAVTTSILYLICLGNDLLKGLIFYEKNIIVNSIKMLKGEKVKAETTTSVFKDFGISVEFEENQKDFIYCLNVLDSLYKIKKRPLVMANFTDLPFETHVPSQRVKGLPLWPDNDVLLFDREKKMYLKLLEESKFDIIFIYNIEYSGYYFTNYVFQEKSRQNYHHIYKFNLKKYEGKRSISVMLKNKINYYEIIHYSPLL
jgi:hypothetical protein